ncbi:MAG: hypothetical protein ACP5HI_03685 [Caldimicrobium sp.]|jgi:Mg-chelatase subunit ChlI
MKRALVILLSGVLVSTATSLHAVETCLKCHKSMNKVAANINKSGAKTPEELVDYLRNKSPMKGAHRSVKDEDIKKAFQEVKQGGKEKEGASAKEAPAKQTEKRKEDSSKKGSSMKQESKSKESTKKGAQVNQGNNTKEEPSKKEAPANQGAPKKRKVEGC